MSDSSLTYTVGADTSKYDNAMGRLKTTTQQSTAQMLFAFTNATGGINRSLTTVETQIGRTNAAVTQGASAANSYGEAFKGIQSAADAFIFVSAAVEGTTNIVNRLKEAISDAQGRIDRLLRLAQQSQSTGAGAGFIASLTAQFKELGVEAGTVQAILAHAKEAATVRQGEGAEGTVNASAFQNRLRLQIGAGNLPKGSDAAYNAADTAEERYKAVFDLIQKLEDANKHLAAQDLGKSFFGDDFEKLANQGLNVAQAFQKAAEAAKGKDAGATDEQVSRATELKKSADDIGKIYDDTVKQALRDIAYLQDAAAQKSLEWQRYVAEVASNFKGIYEYVRNIVLEAVKFGQSLGLIGENFGKFTKPGAAGEGGKTSNANEQASTAPADGESEPLLLHIGNRNGKGRGRKLKGTDETKPIITGTRGGSGDAKEPDAVEQYIRALNKARDVQQAELEAVGKTVAERERLLALARAEAAARDDFEKGRRSSASLDADEKARVLAGADRLGELKAKTVDLEQAQRQAADAARYFGQSMETAFGDAILEGKSFSNVVSDLLKQLARASLSAAFTGQGRIGGVFGFKAKAEEAPGVGDQRVPVPGRSGGVDGRSELPRGRNADGGLGQGRDPGAPQRGGGGAGAEPVPPAHIAPARAGVRHVRRDGGRPERGRTGRRRAA